MAKPTVRNILQFPPDVRGYLSDRSDPTGEAWIRPKQFEQAWDLLKRHGARVNGGEDEYHREVAEILRPSAKRFGYNPELIAAHRVRWLVEIDAARARWQTLPSPEWVKKAVNEVVARYKSEFASSAAQQDSAAVEMANALVERPFSYPYSRAMTVWQEDGRPAESNLTSIANPGNQQHTTKYLEARKKSGEAQTRVLDLSDVLNRQIKSGRVNLLELMRLVLPGPRGF